MSALPPSGSCGVSHCPCQDGDPCHYEDDGDTKAFPHPDGERAVHLLTGERGEVTKMWGRKRVAVRVLWDSGLSGIGWLDDLRVEGRP